MESYLVIDRAPKSGGNYNHGWATSNWFTVDDDRFCELRKYNHCEGVSGRRGLISGVAQKGGKIVGSGDWLSLPRTASLTPAPLHDRGDIDDGLGLS